MNLDVQPAPAGEQGAFLIGVMRPSAPGYPITLVSVPARSLAAAASKIACLPFYLAIEIDMSTDAMVTHERTVRWRMSLALVLWIGGFFLPLAIPLVTGLPLPLATKTALSALLIFGLPQLLTVIAIAIVGKAGFRYLKERLFGAARKLGPPVHVSRIRYRIGLVMLFLPLAVSLVEPYITLLAVQEHLPHWVYGAVNDTLFLTSFFVLGGEFWDKVKALFIYEARAVFPAVSAPRVANAAGPAT